MLFKCGEGGDCSLILLWNAWEEEQEKCIDWHMLEDVDSDN